MDGVTALRTQVPPPAPAQPPTAELTARAPVGETVAPVAAVQRADAIRQASGGAAQVSVALAERDEGHHPVVAAKAAAEAARDAYIKASIAAGISPLPLPGA